MAAFWYLGSKTERSVEALEVQLSQGETPEERELEARVLSYKQKLDDFAQAASKRLYPDNFFPFLEATTHPDVFFTSLSLNPGQASATLTGEASDFLVLAEQVAVLKASEEVDSFTLSSIKPVEEGGIGFSLNIVFPEGFFATPLTPTEEASS